MTGVEGDGFLVERFVTKEKMLKKKVVFARFQSKTCKKTNTREERCKIYVEERDLY